MQTPSVGVSIVTWNSERDISLCLRSILSQDNCNLGQNYFVQIIDNNSTDKTVAVVTEVCKPFMGSSVDLIVNSHNQGFCRAHNQSISALLSQNVEFVLVLNPDVRLEKGALHRLLTALNNDPISGAATPKLLRAGDNLEETSPPRFDATGMYMTPSMRHFDRGSEEIDSGQFDKPEYVFGGSGAALLLRKSAILDVSHGLLKTNNSETNTPERHELFDENFFAYREDADLAWRLQRAGWRCRYEPQAIGYHRRVVLPERRKQLAQEINAYGVRNRFLLQIKNFSTFGNAKHLPFTLFRNLTVIFAVLFIERSSLSELFKVKTLLKDSLRKRRQIFSKQRVSELNLQKWFSFSPRTLPCLTQKPRPQSIRSILAVVINYNSGVHLQRCLESLRDSHANLRDLNLTVVVFDNASSDKSFQDLFAERNLFPDFQWEASPKNLGFAGAINTAAKEYASTAKADALLILNPDIIVDAAVLRQLARALDNFESLGAVAPVLQSPDLNPQCNFVARHFPTLRGTLAELFLLHRLWPSNPWTSWHQMTDDLFHLQVMHQCGHDSRLPYLDRHVPVLVDQPAGACLLIHQEAFENLGGFDQVFWPAWFEDVDFCKRLSENGKLSAIVPDCIAIHAGGHTLNFLGTRNFSICWYPNLMRYWKKHGSVLRAAFVRIALGIGLLARAIMTFVSACLKRGVHKIDKSGWNSSIDLAKTYAILAFTIETYDHAKVEYELGNVSSATANGRLRDGPLEKTTATHEKSANYSPRA